MNSDPMAGINVRKFSKARQEGFEISFSDLFKLAENVLGKPIKEVVRYVPLKFPITPRDFWMNVDDGASQDQTFDVDLKDWFDDHKSNYQYIFGEDWVYKPVAELSEEEIEKLEFNTSQWNNSTLAYYLYYPVVEAMISGLGEIADKNLRIYYDW